MKSKVVKFKKKVGNAPVGHTITVPYPDSHGYPHVQDILNELKKQGLLPGSVSLSTHDYEILK
jgi:hypothetical protein